MTPGVFEWLTQHRVLSYSTSPCVTSPLWEVLIRATDGATFRVHATREECEALGGVAVEAIRDQTTADLTLLYYTANRIAPKFAMAVLDHLLATTRGVLPVVSVSQEPIPWLGQNLCVGPIGASIYNVYKQILMGAEAATTPYIACVEDDSLYVPAHFAHRPADDVFAYNRHRWVLSRRLAADGKSREAFFYFRERTQMAQCICRRELLVETLRERFEKYPNPVPDAEARATGWGEPGRYEKNLGLPRRTRVYFETPDPNITLNHAESLRGRRQVQATDRVTTNLPPWGEAATLWSTIHG